MFKKFLVGSLAWLSILVVGAEYLAAQTPVSENTAIIPTPAGAEPNPAASASPAAAPAADASPTPTPVNQWLKEHESFLALAKKGDIDLLFIGDSITNRWKSAGKVVWKERYAPLKAANFGIGGDKTQNVLWRIQNGELDGIKPKAVVLMIGTNNTGKNTAPEISEAITLIVKEIRQRLPDSKIILVAILPRGETPNERRNKIVEINKTIAALADNQTIFFLDFGSQLLTPEGTITKEMMTDALHINAPGYEIWANAMQPQIDAIFKP